MNKIFSVKLVRVILILAIVTLGTLLIPVISNFIDRFSTVIYPLIFALGLSYVVHQLAKNMGKRLHIKNNAINTVIVLFLIICYLVLVLFFVIPQLIETFANLIPTIVDLFNKIVAWFSAIGYPLAGVINWDEVKNWFVNNAPTIWDFTSSAISSTIEFIADTIIWFFMFILIVFDFNAIGTFWGNYWNRPKHGKYSNYFKAVNDRMHNISIAYIKIVAIDSVILVAVFTIIGLPNAFALGLLGGLLALIPYIGPFLMGAIAILMGIGVSPQVATMALVAMVIWPIIDGNFIQPKILSKTFKVKPAVILLTMITLMITFGPFMGIIFAYPTTVFIATAYDFWKNNNNLQ